MHQQYNRIFHGQAACAALESGAREPDRRRGAAQLRIRHVQASKGLKTLSFMTTHSTAQNRTDCNDQLMLFQALGSRQVEADFSGGYLSKDGGVLLVRQLDQGLGLTRRLAGAFIDRRDPRYCDHALEELLDQRLYGLVLGYEDLNDHDTLRHDPLLAVAVNKREPLGEDRRHAHPPGVALAGSATLNRLELGNQKQDRTHKIQYEPEKIEECLLVMGVRCLPKHAKELVIDLDGMGHLVHGMQEGRHFNAYYDGYCYRPLYAFVGSVPLLEPV
jgi:hypothetical protein